MEIKNIISDFVEGLKIDKGSILLLTENSLTLLMALKKIDKDSKFNIDELFDMLIDKLIEELGGKGTLLIQTFDWRFCRGKKWNIKNSKSRTSFVGNIALKRDDFIRTKHPIYSFAVTGKYKNELASLANIGAFDKTSPFYFIYEKKAKMIMIDVLARDCFTFVHFVEEMEQVHYRFNKSFVSVYVDMKGAESVRSYDMYVRDLEKNLVVDIVPLENLLIENNVMKTYVVNELSISYVDLFEAYNIIANDIRNNYSQSLCKAEGN